MNAKFRKQAEEIARKICAMQKVAEEYPDLSGARKTLEYASEFMNEVYWGLVDFDEDIEFISMSKFQKFCDDGNPLYFDGEFVKIFRTLDVYSIYCVPLNKLGSCYIKAKENNFEN